jgi:hypothetical protein
MAKCDKLLNRVTFDNMFQFHIFPGGGQCEVECIHPENMSHPPHSPFNKAKKKPGILWISDPYDLRLGREDSREYKRCYPVKGFLPYHTGFYTFSRLCPHLYSMYSELVILQKLNCT